MIARKDRDAQDLREPHPMLYLTASVWITAAVLMAWGVIQLWSRLLLPSTLDRVLLPGVLIAKIGRIIGLLLAGASEPPPPAEKGGPQACEPLPRIPIIGPILVGLFPVTLLLSLVYFVSHRLGPDVLARIPVDPLPPTLPTTLDGIWSQLRSLLTLGEATMNALFASRLQGWAFLGFVYLMICLTVSLAPSPGNARGQIGAVGSLGLLALISASIFPRLPDLIAHSWPLLCLTVGWLVLLLLLSLAISGVVLSARSILWPR